MPILNTGVILHAVDPRGDPGGFDAGTQSRCLSTRCQESMLLDAYIRFRNHSRIVASRSRSSLLAV